MLKTSSIFSSNSHKDIKFDPHSQDGGAITDTPSPSDQQSNTISRTPATSKLPIALRTPKLPTPMTWSTPTAPKKLSLQNAYNSPAEISPGLKTVPAIKETATTLPSNHQEHPTQPLYRQVPHPARMGFPCTVGCLDHLLECGHKVVTLQSELCAGNCVKPRSSILQHNQRDGSERFVCMSCIVEDLAKQHAIKSSEFLRELEVLAAHHPKPEGWVGSKLGFMQSGWRHELVCRLDEPSKQGRFCHAMFVNEEYEKLVREVMALNQRTTIGSQTLPPDENTPAYQELPTQPSPRITLGPPLLNRQRRRQIVRSDRKLPVAVYC